MTTSKRTTRRTGGAQSEKNGAALAAGGALSENGAAAHAPAAALKAAKPRARRPKAAATAAAAQHPEDRHASIAMAAYFRSQLRGFQPGYELEDWLAAEEEVNQRIGLSQGVGQ
jgi:hypothetical protein